MGTLIDEHSQNSKNRSGYGCVAESSSGQLHPLRNCSPPAEQLRKIFRKGLKSMGNRVKIATQQLIAPFFLKLNISFVIDNCRT